ncbi:MAG: hypothetical protein ACOVO1_05875, partial [Chitinophagaceae bacterium]
MNQSLVTGWTTTATDQQIELWSSGFQGVTAYAGNQFAELNANQVGTQIQTFPATAGDQLSIGFAHRGRAGTDVMSVVVGPVGGPYVTIGTYTDGNTAWGYYNVGYTVPTTGNIEVRFTSVSAAGGSLSVGNFIDAVSVSLIPLPIIVGSNTGCPNVPVSYSVSNVYSSYNWVVTGGTIISGQGTPNVNVRWNATGTRTLKTTVTNASGCT